MDWKKLGSENGVVPVLVLLRVLIRVFVLVHVSVSVCTQHETTARREELGLRECGLHWEFPRESQIQAVHLEVHAQEAETVAQTAKQQSARVALRFGEPGQLQHGQVQRAY